MEPYENDAHCKEQSVLKKAEELWQQIEAQAAEKKSGEKEVTAIKEVFTEKNTDNKQQFRTADEVFNWALRELNGSLPKAPTPAEQEEAIAGLALLPQEPINTAGLEQDTAQPSATVEPHIGVATPEEKVLQKYAPMRRYYITDLRRLEEMAKLQVLFLGKIALVGQSTVIYARQNTGKTLLVLYLIIEAIKAEALDPSRLIYINMDDNGKGLLEKARLAQEFGFQMVADGYNGFEATEFHKSMQYMVENDKAQGVIVVLDTLKKFVNAMDKSKATEFTKEIRRFIMKGGTVIALSHVNKNPGRDGKVVYSGTTDIIDDFDCGYTLDTVSDPDESHIRTVLFENIKRRGDVAESAAFTYTTDQGVSYEELLASVQEIDPEQSAAIRQETEIKSYGEVVAAIVSCIKEGINTKMLLVSEVAVRANISRRNAIKVIDMFTGGEPDKHQWAFEVKERGAKVFRLLERPAGHLPAPAITTP
jgi:hypothetical protein